MSANFSATGGRNTSPSFSNNHVSAAHNPMSPSSVHDSSDPTSRPRQFSRYNGQFQHMESRGSSRSIAYDPTPPVVDLLSVAGPSSAAGSSSVAATPNLANLFSPQSPPTYTYSSKTLINEDSTDEAAQLLNETLAFRDEIPAAVSDVSPSNTQQPFAPTPLPVPHISQPQVNSALSPRPSTLSEYERRRLLDRLARFSPETGTASNSSRPTLSSTATAFEPAFSSINMVSPPSSINMVSPPSSTNLVSPPSSINMVSPTTALNSPYTLPSPMPVQGQFAPSPHHYTTTHHRQRQYPISNHPPANPADQNPPCNTLYVGNLPMDAVEDELKALFAQQQGYKRLCFRVKQQGPMCFVEFENISFASRALDDLYGYMLHNSIPARGGLRLSFSKNPLGVRSSQNASNHPDSPSVQSPSSLASDGSGVLSFATASGPPPGLFPPAGLGIHNFGGMSNIDIHNLGFHNSRPTLGRMQ